MAADASTGTAVLVTAAVLAGQLSIGWSNDLIDVARDRATGRRDKPLVSDGVSERIVLTACRLALVACVVLSLACGWRAGLVHLGCVAAGWAYNLGVKSTLWSWLPYAVAFGFLPVFVSLAADGTDAGDATALPWWVAVAAALVGVGAHFVNAVPDLADDAATGVRGLPHRLGARPATVLAVALLASATLVVVLASSVRGTGVGWAGVGVVLVLSGVALIGRGRTPFQAAIAVALVDVAMLAWAL